MVVKGGVPWNKGKTYRIPSLQRENHYRWRGDDVSYVSLHKWIRLYKTLADGCENCGVKCKLHAANISGEYRRDVNDYKWLCSSCHAVSHGRSKGSKNPNYDNRGVKSHWYGKHHSEESKKKITGRPKKSRST